MTRSRILQFAIVCSALAVAVADIAMSSDLVIARLFTLPLALCVFQPSILLLAATTASAIVSTIITGLLIHFRAIGDAGWTDAANRGLLIGSLLVFSIFIYLVMRNVRLRLADAARIEAMSEELAARNVDLTGQVGDAVREISERKAIEEELRRSQERHRMAVEVAEMGTWTWNIETGEIVWSEEYRRLFGFAIDEPLSRAIVAARIDPTDMPRIDAAVKTTIATSTPYDVEYRIIRPDGSLRWLVSRGRLHRTSDGAPHDMQGVIMDITERKQVQLLIAQREAEAQRIEALARSNEELQQFAYIAAHDLQEPLRMVASYTQLLSQRYKGRLDGDADDFIAFAVDGARRMQALITDLLAYCRVETAGKALLEISSREAFDDAVRNLEGTVAENDAHIVCGQLPMVMADRTQLIQLFQNLVGNAIKYRTPERPEIRVSAERGGSSEWIFSVRDNGIGIDPKYSEKIFLMFQRLHSRDEFSGTGIGLTLCKKIAERHGGRIWVEPNAGPGSTFHVALPERVLQ